MTELTQGPFCIVLPCVTWAVGVQPVRLSFVLTRTPLGWIFWLRYPTGLLRHMWEIGASTDPFVWLDSYVSMNPERLDALAEDLSLGVPNSLRIKGAVFS